MTVRELESIGIIREITINKNEGRHSKCEIKLLIEDEKKFNDLDRIMSTEMSVEDERRIYMRGFVNEISYDDIFSGSQAVVSIISFSNYADYEKKDRIFQNPEKRIVDIINCLSSEYMNVQVNECDFSNEKEKHVLVQEKKTDFQYLLELANYCGVYAFVNDTDKKASIILGKNSGVARSNFDEEKILERRVNISKFYKDLMLTTTEYMNFGQEITYSGDKYTIVKMIIRYKDGEIHFTYGLRKKIIEKCNLIYQSLVLGKAKVVCFEDGEKLGRVQVEFLDYEDALAEKRIWLSYLPNITDKNQGVVLIPHNDEIVHVVCDKGKCYVDGCIREQEYSEDICNTNYRHIMFGDNCFSIKDDSVEARVFKHKISATDKSFNLSNDNYTVDMSDEKMTIKLKDSKINLDFQTVQILSGGGAKIEAKGNTITIDGSNKVAVKTSAFDVI